LPHCFYFNRYSRLPIMLSSWFENNSFNVVSEFALASGIYLLCSKTTHKQAKTNELKTTKFRCLHDAIAKVRKIKECKLSFWTSCHTVILLTYRYSRLPMMLSCWLANISFNHISEFSRTSGIYLLCWKITHKQAKTNEAEENEVSVSLWHC